MVSDMEVDKVADKVAYMVADMFAKMVADKKKRKNYINISMEIQFGERVGHKGWLIRPKLFRPKAYPTCLSSIKLCKFISKFTSS